MAHHRDQDCLWSPLSVEVILWKFNVISQDTSNKRPRKRSDYPGRMTCSQLGVDRDVTSPKPYGLSKTLTDKECMGSWKNRSGRAESEHMPISLANFIPRCSLEQGNWGDRKSGDFLGEAGLSWLTWPSRHFPWLRSTPFLTLEFYFLWFLWHSPSVHSFPGS